MRCMPFVLATLTTTVLASCAPKPPELAHGGTPPSAAAETGRTTVLAVSGATAPLIVDWSPELRADLEEAMHDGVAVVSFDQNGMKLLRRCQVDGKYGFIGITTKYQVVQLENADEVRANLPLGGASLIAKLGAELEQGKTLDVSMAMIGKKRTTWRDVTQVDLRGECSGATHFVRGATVGAFVLDTGIRGKVKAAVEILSAGGGYQTGTSKKIHNADGSLDACKLATPEGEAPPSQCAALIRLELQPIAKADAASTPGPAKTDAREVESADVGCPDGMVPTNGKCAPRAAAKTHLCADRDVRDCATQCDLGDPGSCNNLGVILIRGEVVPANPAQADLSFKRGCEAGSPEACVNLAVLVVETNPTASVALAARGCRDGNAFGCELVGEAYHFGRGVTKDAQMALRAYKAGCDGGDHGACTNLGLLYAGAAVEIPKNEPLALMYTKRACDGGVATACGNLGLKYEFGVAVKKDERRAVELFERACRMGGGANCLRMAIAAQSGFGIKKDDRMAKSLFEVACRDGESTLGVLGCAALNLSYGSRVQLPARGLELLGPVMQPQCEQDVPRACTFLGVANLGQGKRTAGEMYLNAGCRGNDYWACDLKKRIGVR